jgi:ABC-type branched-subunit amino acid transport system substrate-binding protein
VQGYDAAQMLAAGLAAVKGDFKKAEMVAAMRKAKVDSPRGKFTLSKAHNPVQDIYLRQVVGKENKVIGAARAWPIRPAAARTPRPPDGAVPRKPAGTPTPVRLRPGR